MKRTLAFLSVALVTFAVATALALNNVGIPEGFYDGSVTALKPQVDHNLATTNTLYTPRRWGDILIGGKGTAASPTSAVWIAISTNLMSGTATTNQWKQINP